MQAHPKKRKLMLFSVVLMLASLACLCTGGFDLDGITGLVEETVPEEITIIEDPLPEPEISDPIEAPEAEPQDSDTTPGDSTIAGTSGLEIIDTNYYEDDFGAFTFLVLVENTGSVGLEFVEASVTLKDSTGSIVANESFFSTVDLIEPGGRSPISVVWFDGVPEWETFEIFVEGDEVNADFDFYYTDVEVTTSELAEDEFGSLEIIGEVQNVGDAATDFVSIVAILYDADGRIIGEGFSFTEADTLQPGDTSPFTIFFFGTGGDVDSYDLIAQGSEISE